jgi:RNA polymerase sigma factor (sigma-70 family)
MGNNDLTKKIRFLSPIIDQYNLSPTQKKTLEHLLNKSISYIPDQRFQDGTMMHSIMHKDIYVTPGEYLNTEDLEVLFLQMNYARHKIFHLRQKLLENEKFLEADILKLLDWHHKQNEARNKIVTANIGLVCTMIKNTYYAGVEFPDLFSEGSIALLKAAEQFDCARGFKFSTYACRAIQRNLYRYAKRYYRYRDRFQVQLELSLEKNVQSKHIHEPFYQDTINDIQDIYRNNLADLSSREQFVMEKRFPLDKDYHDPLTLKQLGETMGLSKERIRQIQNKALAKLRTLTKRHVI